MNSDSFKEKISDFTNWINELSKQHFPENKGKKIKHIFAMKKDFPINGGMTKNVKHCIKQCFQFDQNLGGIQDSSRSAVKNISIPDKTQKFVLK